ncbi:hypothetical protein LX36DRAFT_715745 [Colletotrichum falcatum]|nr:hypothetical protein LX36DRAFT_715745 [Colletotrichum falcatum]
MQITSTLMTLALLAVGINAAPLNINMGAYSPALVVGDGAISFDGGAEAGAGEGAAAGGRAGAGAAEGAAAAAGGAQRELVRRQDAGDSSKVEKRQSGFDRALQFAEVALTKGPDIELGTGEGGAGVGIKVNNQQAAAGGAAGREGGAAGGAGAERA